MTLKAAETSGAVALITPAFDDLLHGLMRYDLWGRLGWLEVKRRYRRTIIGPFWSAVSLAIFVAALGTVGAGLWKQEASLYLPFLAGGMVVWIMISSIINEACSLFVGGQNLFRQMRFDYSILALALVWRNFIVFLHNLSVYFLVSIVMAPQILKPTLIMAIPGLFFVLLNGVWIALLFGMFCLRFRDVQQLVSSLIQIAMFITPIFWQPDNLSPDKRFIFATLNPLYHLIDVVRAPLLGRMPALSTYVAVVIISVVGWVFTYFVFKRFRKRIAYWS